MQAQGVGDFTNAKQVKERSYSNMICNFPNKSLDVCLFSVVSFHFYLPNLLRYISMSTALQTEIRVDVGHRPIIIARYRTLFSLDMFSFRFRAF